MEKTFFSFFVLLLFCNFHFMAVSTFKHIMKNSSAF